MAYQLNKTEPANALAIVRYTFPAAWLKEQYGNYRDYNVVGYTIHLNSRTKLFLVSHGGLVDVDAVCLWRDAQAYARDKAKAKRAAKLAADLRDREQRLVANYVAEGLGEIN